MEVDTLIVGSGVVAAALSQRLLEADPRASVHLLEAGRTWPDAKDLDYVMALNC